MPWRRWFIFALVVPAYTAVLIVISAALLSLLVTEYPRQNLADAFDFFLELMEESDWWITAAVFWGVAVVLQVVFTLPLFARTPPRGGRSRPLSVSLVVGALVAAGLCVGLLLGLLGLLQLVFDGVSSWEPFEIAVGVLIAVVFAGSWGFWTVCLLMFARGIWADRVLGRLVGVLMAGTALEALLVLPVDVMIRRRTDCYCWESSFVALSIAGAAALWLAGPGVVIALLSRRHKAWRRTHCGRCGYPMGPSPGERCPECGYEWRTARKGG